MNPTANPYLHLVSLAWRFAEGRRKTFVGFYALSALGQSTLLALPFLLGKIFGTIQENPDNLLEQLGVWMALYALLNFVFWGIHGPARVMERSLAFRIKQRFIDEHYRMVKDLPMQWHQDHHSGDTINRINKASMSLFEFSQSQFLYIGFFISFLGPLVALAIVSPKVAALAFASGIATMFLIRRYDRVIVPLILEENERDHRFSSAFFDYVSNITTIISLRIGERTREELRRRL
ncbi:MAG: ABC transporter ATP-binding protein, partial [Alphaproteobacteria bacterium]|nr:ABC transporter ATP-binding protein [Alphaproteobacteria bacterium]